MKTKKWFNKQYILLSVSILLGLIVVVLGSSYAYYIVNLTGSDENNDVAIKTSNINLEISNVSGSLKLCKSYPISDTEGLSCTPYKFTLTNNSKASLEYYLNLEYQTDAPEDTINIAFATCGDTSCTNPAYNVSKLSEILDNEDTMLSKYSGKLLTSGSDIEQGTSNTYSIIMWIDKDSEHEDATLTTSVTAITYTQSQNLLSYKVTFDLEDKGTWTTETCKTSEGYTINGTKCEKNVDVNETYGTIPEVTMDGKIVLWYNNGITITEATANSIYTLKSNPIYTPTIIDLTQSFNYDYTGREQIFTVPKTGTYKIETWGAQGGNATYDNTTYIGGFGSYSTGKVYLEKGTTLYINTGGQGQTLNNLNPSNDTGYNGGGFGSLFTNNSVHGGGGGATHIATKPGLLKDLANDLNSILIVSGGGGGASAHNAAPKYSGNGGNAGGYLGVDGGIASTTCYAYGNGGTQTSPGGYTVCSVDGQNPGGYGDIVPSAATFGYGGNYTQFGNSSNNNYYTYAGGGGGYYGGGSGFHAPGGGGSGYIGNSLLTNKAMYCYNCAESSDVSTKTISTTCHSTTPTENCAKEGNGYAKITYVG